MKKKVIIFGILLLFWMIVIFVASNLPGEQSGVQSENIIVYVVHKFDQLTGASKETIEYHNSIEFRELANHLFRKTCHYLVYLILGILAINLLISINKWHLWLSSIFALLLSNLYAFFDEYHQTLVMGRSGELFDVLIDTLGSFTGIVLVCTFVLVHQYRLKKN